MKTFHNCIKMATILLSVLALSSTQAFSANFSEGTANFSGHFSNKILHSHAGFMMPLYEAQQNAAFFVNPVLGFSTQLSDGRKHEERFSLGLGNRLFLPGSQFSGFDRGLFKKGLIFGGNWYYDLQYSPYDNFLNKTGGGVEILSDWVDARFNGYIKLTGEKDLDKRVKNRRFFGTSVYSGADSDYETLLGGFDLEAGLRLPIVDQLGEMRVFAGAYYYDAKHVDDIHGVKGRFEWSPLPFLNVGISYFDNSRLHGEHWLAQLAVKLPFSMNAMQYKGNPFSIDYTPKTGNIWKDRYTTPVLRNGMI